jgi:hypothetical protein
MEQWVCHIDWERDSQFRTCCESVRLLTEKQSHHRENQSRRREKRGLLIEQRMFQVD